MGHSSPFCCYPCLVPTSVASHQRRVTQPPFLGCLLVHRFSLWVLYRQRLLAFCADNIKTRGGGGGESPAYSHEHISRLCPGAPNSPSPLNARYGVELLNFLFKAPKNRIFPASSWKTAAREPYPGTAVGSKIKVREDKRYRRI